jgi:hypothetical protein
MNSKNPAQTDRASQPKRKRLGLRIAVSMLAIVFFAVGGLVAVPIISPATGAAMADWLRGIIGPEATAEIESVAFKLQDVFNSTRYQVSGGQSQISWEDPTVTTTKPAADPAPAPRTGGSLKPVANKPIADPIEPRAPRPAGGLGIDVVTAPSDVTGWQSFGATAANSDPIMARAVVKPDPTRPYAQAALVRIDLSKVQLHLMPGTVEPTAVKGAPAVARSGEIPATDQVNGLLLAAFNGGFKAVHGGYGMQLDSGAIIRPAMDGIATLGLYRDGTVKIGAWGRDLQAGSDLIAFRQNCLLLVDAGQINPHVNDESRKEWGYTVKNLDTTWRSGVGLSKDGRFLIYAVGNSLTVESLAQALQQAGAEYAMQLDINGFYTRFVTYAPATDSTAGPTLVANKLLKEMSGDPALFLHPYDRDFFYLTVKPGV